MSDTLRETIRKIGIRIQKYQERSLGEQNTKASLIEPVLEALGWDVRDPDEVQREFKPTTKDCPVDYALALLREPKLFVEAKALGELLSDRKWITQVLGYATVAGVEWCVLTDGNEYRFYNATAPVDAEEKLFFRIKLSEGQEDEAVKTLNLICKSNLSENILNVLWNSHFVDRRVKRCLKRMIENRDKGLMRLIRKRTPKLTPKEIAHSLRRLEIRIESPAALVEPSTGKEVRKPSTKMQEAGKKAALTRQYYGKITLADVIAASLLKPPVVLFRKYKGHRLEATLHPDGMVEFQGTSYDSCSAAAEHARSTITGRKMNTNGWVFWQYTGEAGKKLTLDHARKTLLAMRGKKV